jgi:hypothetical protein
VVSWVRAGSSGEPDGSGIAFVCAMAGIIGPDPRETSTL